MHYQRNRKTGDPLKVIRAETPTRVIRRWVDILLASERDRLSCIAWPFGRDLSTGYGAWNGGGLKYAHRGVCRLAHGDAPPDRPMALHRCGQGHNGCVNPGHLYWGDKRQNSIDMVRTIGHPNQKLTVENVEAIRSSSLPHSVLSAQFGVSVGTIKQVRRRRSWTHVP
jgi:hypothetical protein